MMKTTNKMSRRIPRTRNHSDPGHRRNPGGIPSEFAGKNVNMERIAGCRSLNTSQFIYFDIMALTNLMRHGCCTQFQLATKRLCNRR